MKNKWLVNSILILIFLSTPLLIVAQEVLPFPPTPSASMPGRTIQESSYRNRKVNSHLPKDAPNILIILIDDAGPGLPDTYGGEVHTPALTKLSDQGISFNRFHSTGMCSPTRSSLLTGRNHTRIGNGQITELANDWDGFSGIIPKTSATAAEVLRNYGYNTAAFGKWHNTPANQTSKAGPFDFWPTGYGFEYFYGFLNGEASQYEPTLVKNTTYVTLPKTPEQGYHLSDDLADNAIQWLHEHKAMHPDQPFFMYWAPGAVHGPHHVPKKWSDKYKGKFDDGWDKYRERVFANPKQLGWIPKDTKLTPRHESLTAWDDIPEVEKPFQRRLMEIFAGFAEQADHDAGRVIDEIEKMGLKENTIIFYIWGDNGSSAEGQNGTISELLAQNQIPTEVSQHIEAANKLGGLSILGSPKSDNMYHAGWAWAGSTPFKGTKLLASHFGGIRQPLVVSWPKKIRADKTPRPQFHHVNDIVPTLYEIIGINPPVTVNGLQQDPIDGTSMNYAFNDANSKGKKLTQFFDIMASRSIYHDGWMASAFGPRIPWVTVTPGMATWTPDKDKWELYNLEEDFSQANDLADKYPEKLSAMKEMFLIESTKNQNLPIGGGLYLFYHPDSLLSNPATKYSYSGDINRVPEAVAPRIGSVNHTLTLDVTLPEKGNGVLFALGGFSGGLTCYLKNGVLFYEYNLLQVERTTIKGKAKLPKGKSKIEVEFQRNKKPNSHLYSADITIRVNGKEYTKGNIPTLITLAFAVNECFDIGMDLGSPVSLDYYEIAPNKLNGTVHNLDVLYRE